MLLVKLLCIRPRFTRTRTLMTVTDTRHLVSGLDKPLL